MKEKFKKKRDRKKVSAKRFLKSMKRQSTMFDKWTDADAIAMFSDNRQRFSGEKSHYR